MVDMIDGVLGQEGRRDRTGPGQTRSTNESEATEVSQTHDRPNHSATPFCENKDLIDPFRARIFTV